MRDRWLEHAVGLDELLWQASMIRLTCPRKEEWLEAGYVSSFDSGEPFFHLL